MTSKTNISIKPVDWARVNSPFEAYEAKTRVGTFTMRRRFLDGRFELELPEHLSGRGQENKLQCMDVEDGKAKVEATLRSVISEMLA